MGRLGVSVWSSKSISVGSTIAAFGFMSEGASTRYHMGANLLVLFRQKNGFGGWGLCGAASIRKNIERSIGCRKGM